MLVTSNFSFSHNVFLSYISIVHQYTSFVCGNGLTHYQTTNFKLKEFAEDNFKFDEKGRKLSTGRKHCGKRRTTRHEQFLLFPQCFQKACFPEASKSVIVRNGLKTGWWIQPMDLFLSGKDLSSQVQGCSAQIPLVVSDQSDLYLKNNQRTQGPEKTIKPFTSQCQLLMALKK